VRGDASPPKEAPDALDLALSVLLPAFAGVLMELIGKFTL